MIVVTDKKEHSSESFCNFYVELVFYFEVSELYITEIQSNQHLRLNKTEIFYTAWMHVVLITNLLFFHGNSKSNMIEAFEYLSYWPDVVLTVY